jgi:hypothetical protein
LHHFYLCACLFPLPAVIVHGKYYNFGIFLVFPLRINVIFVSYGPFCNRADKIASFLRKSLRASMMEDLVAKHSEL